MKIVQDFLLQNGEPFQYALVEYCGKTEATYFVRHYHDGKPWFLESPCCLIEEYVFSSDQDIEEWCLSLADELLKPDVDRKEYYEKHMKPLIVDNVFYDIDCPQVEPYLPKEIDNIKLITERESLLYLLQEK